ncbi:hypothetical protein DTL42_23320 [Bremerella cremea]|uniref:Uncharacterized protein n=1 Tax=Bremerella cremea TaxID=1031537 RepID=A0A368KNC6_9BACT|nr:hypothetical protein [Bremerella cremea]RCS41485.1 hypothetical protein DTL42_23320 [Bremerella cremea]
MSDSSINPFASPTADISETQAEVYPLVPTTKADVTDVPAPFARTARTMEQRFLRVLSESITSFALALPFILLIFLVTEFYSLRMLLAVILGIPFLLFVVRLEKATAPKAWWLPRMIDQLKVRPGALFSAEETPYQLVFLVSVPKKVPVFRLSSVITKIADIGLIRFDLGQREILLEGDAKRYRIPRGSLWTFDIYKLQFNSGNRAVVRMVLDTDDGPHELYLLPLETRTWHDLIRFDWALVRRAVELAEQIHLVNHGSQPTDL